MLFFLWMHVQPTVEKSESNYQRLAQQAGQQIDRIANRCPHFKMLADAVLT